MKKEIINRFINEATKRFNKKDKIKFAQQLIQDYEELGYQGKIESKKVKMSKVHNIMIGNFKTAKHIIVVPYDTPARVFWWNYRYYPQDGSMTMKRNFIPVYGPMILAYLFLLALVYVLPTLISTQFNGVLFAISSLYLCGLFYFIMKGFPNHKNTVRNNASLAIAYELAMSLNKDKRKQIAFVFTDQNNPKMYGSRCFVDSMNAMKRNANKIVLFCIGEGDTISLGYRKGDRKIANDLQKKFQGRTTIQTKAMDANGLVQTTMEALTNAVIISSGVKEDSALCVKNTCSSKDHKYQEVILDEVKDMLISYLK